MQVGGKVHVRGGDSIGVERLQHREEPGLGFGVWGVVFGVWGLGFGVWGMGYA